MRRRHLAVTGLLACAAALAAAPPQPTTAAWASPEYASGSFEAGRVLAPVSFRCGNDGAGTDVTFDWTAPVGGLTRTAYDWTLTSPGSNQPSVQTPLPAGATSLTVKSGLLALGESRVSLVARGPGGWASTPVTGRFTAAAVLGIPLLSTCSVP